ncbi:MAG TPA: dipeptide/oligopeptide/nickel ABC transporter ATP-binding protein [Sulfurospirillum sp. UBA11407]|jgi:peptide/nickel transport system ATP-binding protein|nr:MAG TPA: dipeptide/oligopeptide/nickel ABC transporter ATP-binding protein [Sulfurospirillum sp. UBA11407]
MSPLLEVKNLKTHFFTRKGVLKAVDGVSFEIEEGEILGIVGESGAGKSITGFSILGLIDQPGKIVEGEILFEQRDLAKTDEEVLQKIRGNEIAMIFQDPQTSLNPVISIGEQMMEVILYHNPKVSKKEAYASCVALLELVGLPAAQKRMKSYPHQLSGGMKQRVVIAMALLNKPKLLIADEPTTALDVTIQAQILFLMKKLTKDFGSSLILITHDIAVVSQLCDKIAVMYAGRIVEYGKKEDVIFHPLHPYTKGLIECLPKLNDPKERLFQIPGIMPSLFELPQGCYFKNRCPLADKECDIYPDQKEFGDRRVFCHKVK